MNISLLFIINLLKLYPYNIHINHFEVRCQGQLLFFILLNYPRNKMINADFRLNINYFLFYLTIMFVIGSIEY